MDAYSVLVIEDNQADILLIREYLSERENCVCRIEEAGTLESALAKCANTNFDVVLLDLSLPDSSGLDTVRRLITKFSDIAVVVLTGLQDEEMALMCVRYGAQDYLEKQQLSPATLYRSILYSIERKRVMHEKEELLNDLGQALAKIELLEEFLPLCVGCNKIFGENQQWMTIQEYAQSSPAFGSKKVICPSCKSHLADSTDF